MKNRIPYLKPVLSLVVIFLLGYSSIKAQVTFADDSLALLKIREKT